TIEETIRFAREIDPDSLQVSLAAPYPGTALYQEALDHGWLQETDLVDAGGVQASVLGYPHLSRTEIFESVESFYRRFYFRPRKIFGFIREMVQDAALCRRRLAEGREFLRFLARRHSST
ncbi:MAG: hopanoid biosynthesis associated radical SAM protein HpnJ, partial [Candidatus Rokuibacteriota bacterium]